MYLREHICLLKWSIFSLLRLNNLYISIPHNFTNQTKYISIVLLGNKKQTFKLMYCFSTWILLPWCHRISCVSRKCICIPLLASRVFVDGKITIKLHYWKFSTSFLFLHHFMFKSATQHIYCMDSHNAYIWAILNQLKINQNCIKQ